MRLTDLTGGVPGTRLVAEAEDTPGTPDITAIRYRSDEVLPGDLFACLPGSRADGHDFAPDAVARGAVAIVAPRPLEGLAGGTPQWIHDAPAQLTGILAQAFAGEPAAATFLAGVTGTNGKTSTSLLLRSILEAAGHPAALFGTITYDVGDRKVPAPTPSARRLSSNVPMRAPARSNSSNSAASNHSQERRPLSVLSRKTRGAKSV